MRTDKTVIEGMPPIVYDTAIAIGVVIPFGTIERQTVSSKPSAFPIKKAKVIETMDPVSVPAVRASQFSFISFHSL